MSLFPAPSFPKERPQSFDPNMYAEELSFFTPDIQTLTPQEQQMYAGSPNKPATHAANAGLFGWRNADIGGQTAHQRLGQLGALAQPVTSALSSGLGFVNDAFGQLAGTGFGQALGRAGESVGNYEAGRAFNEPAPDLESLIAGLTPEQLAQLRVMLGG